MAKILYGTHYINEDEPCLGLFELELQSPGSKGFHRYQIIYVMRGEKPAEFRKDMGLASEFNHDQLRIPGGAYDPDTDKYYVEHTVGELRQIADQLRLIPMDKKDLPNLVGSKMMSTWLDEQEQKRNKRKGRVLV